MKLIEKYLLIALLPVVLVGCSGDEGDDLDRFMNEAHKTMSTKVEPLPEVKPYIPIQFDVDSSLYDPYLPRKVNVESKMQPDMNRAKEPLESYPVENLKFVGQLQQKRKNYALIKAPDNTLHKIKKGNYLGTNFGLVKAISDSEVTLKEIIQDDLSGDWIERVTSLSLQD